MSHEIRLCVRFPWTEIRSCSRCGLVIVNSDRTGISFLRPPPSSKREITNDRNETRTVVSVERGSYSWFELAPTPGSLRHLTPFVASAPLRESPPCVDEEDFQGGASCAAVRSGAVATEEKAAESDQRSNEREEVAA